MLEATTGTVLEHLKWACYCGWLGERRGLVSSYYEVCTIDDAALVLNIFARLAKTSWQCPGLGYLRSTHPSRFFLDSLEQFFLTNL
jgi:hypothetical protein